MAAPAHIARENGKKGGRPKGTNAVQAEKAREYIAMRVGKELEPIIDKAIEQARSGDVQARKDLLDRAYGKPRETMEVTVDATLKLDV